MQLKFFPAGAAQGPAAYDPGRNLRALDAICLSCALQIGDDLGGLVSYDARRRDVGT